MSMTDMTMPIHTDIDTHTHLVVYYSWVCQYFMFHASRERGSKCQKCLLFILFVFLNFENIK